MYSKIDTTSFLKKNDHLNDSIDRSLVNEYTNKTVKDILFEIIKSAFLILAPFLTFFITEITNILIFSHSDNTYIYLKQYINIQCYYYFFGFIFFFGAMKYYESFINYDKREIKLKSIFYNFSRIFYFFSAIIYLIPLSFLSYYPFVHFFKTNDITIFREFYANYFFFMPVIFYLTIIFQLNLQILKHFFSFYYLFGINLILYWGSLFGFSFIVTNKISLITYSLISSNLINLIISHYEIKRNVFYLKDISFFYLSDIMQLKTESFFTFVKYSSVKGILFTLSNPGIYLIIFLSQIIPANFSNFIEKFSFASTLAFIFMSFPHAFILSLAKYYKNYLENSVYEHSQNTKTRYLKFFWFIVIFFSLFFSVLLLLLKTIFFRFLLNLPKNFLVENMNSEISEVFYMYDFIVKFYSIFIFFDSFGISFQEIIKTFNDHSRNYLNFYKGISLVFIFFPIGIVTANFLQWEFFWGFWIGVYSHMVFYLIVLLVVTYRNYYTSTFQITY